MTNDILEQITEDYLRELGYFTQHNISYRPKDSKQTHSDIDVLAIHPLKEIGDPNRVVVVSCKSEQRGIDINEILNNLEKDPNKVIRGRSMSERFREIAFPIWSEALIEKIYKLSGQKEFVFYLAVSHYKGNKESFEDFNIFQDNLPNCQIKIIDLKEMISTITSKITETPSHSELTRLLQLMKSANLEITIRGS
ncbi:MAG: hypothetical protein WCO18_00310 [bacterium]